MSLVQIGAAPKPTDTRTTARAADALFSFGILSSCVGTVMLGNYLWILRLGAGPLATNYLALRSAHAVLQLYSFLGAFILAFLFQAGPKVFGSSRTPLRATTSTFLLLVVGTLLFSLQLELPGKIFISLAFVTGLAALSPMFINGSADVRLRATIPCIVGLLAFAVGIFGPLHQPQFAVTLFWLSVAPVTMAISQQIMHNLFCTTQLSSKSLLLLYLGWFSTACLGLFNNFSPISFWQPSLEGTLAFVTILYFLFFSRVDRLVRARSSYALGFLLAWSWAIVGAVLLILGPSYADYTLHCWAAGFAMTLLFSVSIRIVGAVTGVSVLPESAVTLLILLWQVTPIVRGLSAFFSLLLYPWWLLPATTALVLVLWASSITVAIFRFAMRKQGLKN